MVWNAGAGGDISFTDTTFGDGDSGSTSALGDTGGAWDTSTYSSDDAYTSGGDSIFTGADDTGYDPTGSSWWEGEDTEEGYDWGGAWGKVKDGAVDLWNSDTFWTLLGAGVGLLGGDDETPGVKKPGAGGGGGGGGRAQHGGVGSALVTPESVKEVKKG